MWFVTFVWCLTAGVALLLAGVCVLTWLTDRRDHARLMFCVTAIATAAATPFELGMMQAATPSEFGELMRWYHLPIFFVVLGQLLFVRYYLGTGRLWLLWMIIPIRIFVLVANFFVTPNFNFREISSLQHVMFLGERVSVVGDSTPRTWQWLALASMLMLITFVIDATVQGWRRAGSESRRRALTVSFAIVIPMVGNLALNQTLVWGGVHIPLCATPWFLGTLSVIAYELGRELILNSRARLQLAELRREWAHVERVNSLGQLASALAHELLQPLTAAGANLDAAIEYLRRAGPDADELRSIVKDAHKANLRAGEIIHRMRSFISGRAVAMQAFRLDEVANEVFSLLRYEATSHRVDLKCNLPDALPPACGDRVQISQVILNLVINGIEAADGRAAEVRCVTLEVRIAESESLEITVRDNGRGIPDGQLEKVFDPLFSTKGAGLGVGLALSRMIVDAHGGRLWAENAETGGAIFRFTLPHGGALSARRDSGSAASATGLELPEWGTQS